MESSKLSGERLRAALSQAGLTVEGFADSVAVDERTVRRWLSGLTPSPRHRIAIAKELAKPEAELWPHTAPRLQPEEQQRDRIAVLAQDDQRVPDWRVLLEQASDRIELYDWTLAGLLGHPGVATRLAAKAAAGTSVRLLIASLESLWRAADDLEPHPQVAQSLHDRPLYHAIERVHDLLLPLADQSNIEARQTLAPRSPSLLRFDDHILAAIHLWGRPTLGPLVLHLQRRSEHGPFETLRAHFEALWAQSWPVHQSRPDDPTEHPTPATDPLATEVNGRGWRRRAVLAPEGRRPPRQGT